MLPLPHHTPGDDVLKIAAGFQNLIIFSSASSVPRFSAKRRARSYKDAHRTARP
jgi:hypothetical protein